jgi:subtilisin family serine protease
MTTYRVKAFFMHENELDAAKRAEVAKTITDTEWTEGYVIGLIEEGHVAGLAKQGLVITPIERVETVKPQPGTRSRSGARRTARSAQGPDRLETSIAGKSHDEKVLSTDPSNPQFYVVRLSGPLTPSRNSALKNGNIEFLEGLDNNRYTARLTPDQVTRLKAQSFVDTIRLYNEVDTLSGETTGTVTRGIGSRRFTRPFTVRTHRPEDLQRVIQWLKTRRRNPIRTHSDSLQVALVQDGNDLRDLAKLAEVAAIEEIQLPHPLDRMARQVLRLEQPGNATVGLEGEGQILGIADTGLDDGHPDFSGRIVGTRTWGRPGDHSDPEGHGTHVVGCAAGDGSASNGEVRGAAPKVKLFFQSILDANGMLGGLPTDLSQLFDEAYQNGVRIHNNSWGAFGFAKYSATSRDVDRYVLAHPDMLIVIAAGNDSMAVPRVKGAKTSAKRGFVDWPSMADPANAKNALTVGASRNSRSKGGYAALTWADAWTDRYPAPPIGKQRVSGDAECLAAFSARGPSDSTRIKPDVVAPGTDIAATRSSRAPLFKFWGAYPNNPHYAFMGGTSMAAPYAAGCAALVREFYQKREKWESPSAALLKATLVNGTARMTGGDAIAPLEGEPNFHQGFGRIDMATTIPNPMNPGLKLVFADTWNDPQRLLQASGKRQRFQIEAGNKLPLRICLVWTDTIGRGLQHRLMLLADNAAGRKFVGNSTAAATVNIAGMVEDPNNNVQVIRISKPECGLYTIAVTAIDIQTPQAIALVITGDLQSPLAPMA